MSEYDDSRIGAGLPGLTAGNEVAAICPLCGSIEGRVLIQTDAISFVECLTCAGQDLHFWITRQAGERAEWMRRAGHTIDPIRTKGLIGARRDRGGSTLLRPADVDEIIGDS